jgi:hypothetical protein
MQSEYAMPSADVGLLGISGNATGDHLTPDVATKRGDDPGMDGRWRQWRARGAKADRDTARTMNTGFVAIFVALSAWLVFQLLV